MSILNYEATSDDGFGNIEKVTAQTEPSKARFNPMQSWMNASKVIDQEFGKTSAQTFPANVPADIQPYSELGSAETFGLGREPVVAPYAQTQDFPYPQQLQMEGVMTPQQVAYQNSWQRPPEPDMDYMPDPTALGFANMPYDLTGGPSQGAAPTPVQPAALGSMYSPEAVEAQVMQDDQVMGGSGYSRPMMPGMEAFGSMNQTSGMSADQQFADGAMKPGVTSSAGTEYDDDWMRAHEQDGSSREYTEAHNAITITASNQTDGSNMAGGVDASDDPVMRQRLGDLATNPAKRREAYMKRLNTAFLQSIALDTMAAMMGVKSRAGQFMEMTQKAIDAEMKFDDEERLAEIDRAVFFPNGEYDPPGNKRDAFDRALRAGASVEEAAAISGHLPEQEEVGYDTYFKSRPDGSVETLYVPKGQSPPEGSTPASGVATHNAKALGIKNGEDLPADARTAQRIVDLQKQARDLRAAGREEEANAAQTQADLLTKIATGSRSNPETGKRQMFDSLWGAYFKPDQSGRIRDTFYTTPKADVALTKNDLFQMFLNMPGEFPIYDRFGKEIKVTPYSRIVSPQDGSNVLPKAVAIDILRANPTEEVLRQFVEVYGVDALPEEFK